MPSNMKDTAVTVATAITAIILGAITWPTHPGLAITAWTITGAAGLTWAAAATIRRAGRR